MARGQTDAVAITSSSSLLLSVLSPNQLGDRRDGRGVSQVLSIPGTLMNVTISADILSTLFAAPSRAAGRVSATWHCYVSCVPQFQTSDKEEVFKQWRCVLPTRAVLSSRLTMSFCTISSVIKKLWTVNSKYGFYTDESEKRCSSMLLFKRINQCELA